MCFSRSVVTVTAAILFAVPVFAQTQFQYQQYDGVGYVAAPTSHSADFNGDGLADVISTIVYDSCTASSPTCTVTVGLDLYLNSATGFKAPVALPVTLSDESAITNISSMAISDFNGDGYLDVAVLSSTGTVSLLYGHGDGTFANPVTIQLPAGSYTSLVKADFDVNNTQDLAALNSDGTLTLLFNDGKGSFTQQQTSLETPPSGYTATDLVVGDFSGHGRPDVAWIEQGDGNSQQNTLWSALNTAKGVFTSKYVVGTLPAGFGNVVAADLDLDGKSDLISWVTQLPENCCAELPVTLYYSKGDGTFTASALDSTISTGIGVTDINGDGNPDVVVAGNTGLTVYTGNGDRTFTRQDTYTGLPGGPFEFGLGFYNSTNRMGLATTNAEPTNTGETTFLYQISNDYTQGDCTYPTSPGIRFCSAAQNGGQVRVRGTARAQTQPVRHIELWANGVKLYQVFSDEFDATLTLPEGTVIKAIEVEANGATRSATTTAKAGGDCAAPDAAGVDVCSPTAGQSVTSPVTFIASGTGASGSVNHLELWIDGTKIGNYTGSTMDASLKTLSSGSHTATIVEVDSKGDSVKSTPVPFIVATSSGCVARGFPGVNVCSPTEGENVTSPVRFIATGTGVSGSVNHMELWIDGTKIGNYGGPTMDASLTTLPIGSHTATIIEVDSKGDSVKSEPVTFLVGMSSACSVPSTAGVHVCLPTAGESVTSPVTFSAAGTGASGSVNHLELWIDGTKIANYSGPMVFTDVAEPSGSHRAAFIEVDATGAHVESTPVTFVVK